MDPITQQVVLATAGAAAGENYWIATLGGTNNEVAYAIAADSSGNAYVAAYTLSAGAGASDLLIAKYDTSGTIQWQRTLGGTGSEQGEGIAVDGSGNVYVIARTSSTGAGATDTLIAKYNASGAIQWQRVLGGTNNDYSEGIAVDSSGNVYGVARINSAGAGNYDFLIVKYNTSGTIQWQRTLGGTTTDRGYGIAVDSSGNVYVTGNTRSTGAGDYDCLIAKYNTSGAIQWQRTLGGTSSFDQGYGIAVDSSGNVYVTGYTQAGAGNGDCFIAKYNTSGTIQWQRTLGGTDGDFTYGIAVDGSGNAYIAGTTSSAGVNGAFLIAKYNTSGTIQWQRTLDSTGTDTPYGIAVDGLGNIYVGGSTNVAAADNYDCLIAKLPDDGSLTGTYGSFTYASSSLTDASSSLTDASSSLTDASSSLTDASSSLTDASSSLTSSTTTL